MSDMRQAFLDAITADPYDLHTRKVFADWLDEFGDEKDADLAVVQRSWTKEKQDAIVWLTQYGSELGSEWDEDEDEDEYKPRAMTYDELIEAANAYITKGEDYCLPSTTPDRVYEDNDEFWRRYELATGEKVAEEKKSTFFRCAC